MGHLPGSSPPCWLRNYRHMADENGAAGPAWFEELAANALASSVVLVCRLQAPSRHHPLPDATSSLRSKPSCRVALTHLQSGNIAPVDLPQAAIGPGMAVYTRYAKVLDATGKPLSQCVRRRRSSTKPLMTFSLSRKATSTPTADGAASMVRACGLFRRRVRVAADTLHGQGDQRRGTSRSRHCGLGRGKVRLLEA